MFADTAQQSVESMPDFDLADLVKCVLDKFSRDMKVDCVAVYAYNKDISGLVSIAYAPTPDAPSSSVDSIVANFCAGNRLTTSLDKIALSGSGYASGKALMLTLMGEPIGALVLLWKSKQQPNQQNPQLHACFATVQALVQNHYRSENDAVARTVASIARQVGTNDSPQDLVNIVGENLLGPKIRFCALLLYGPRREDRPNGPFGYLEVQGVWAKRFGPGIGVGMHLYLDQYTELLEELEQRKTWHIPDIRAIETRFDSLVRGFIRSSGIQSILMIALGSAEQRLGVLIVGTEDDHEFTQRDIRSFQGVSEFLAMSTMAQFLQQQHDFVQRGRAALLDAVYDGVLMILPNVGTVSGDNSKSYVLTVNQAFSSMFSISQMRAQGLPVMQLLNKMQLPEDVRQELNHHWLSISVRDPAIQRGDFTMIHPDGHHASIGWYSGPVYQANRVIGRIYIFHDVTDDRTAISLRANFVSRMSHELRTPLTSIKGFAQYMLEELKGDLTPAVRDYVEIIKDNAELLNTLFSDIIEITRADLGDLKLNLTASELSDLVEHVILPFEEKGVEQRKWIEVAIDSDLPPAHMDPSWVNRVLSQLLDNAFQHAPIDTAIHIRAQAISEGADMPVGAPADVVIPSILVTVEDEGDGIAVEDVEMIFQPFYRTRDARALRLDGSGLGLALARSIVQMHRGKIWAEPRKRGRRGARIHFTLPTAAD